MCRSTCQLHYTIGTLFFVWGHWRGSHRPFKCQPKANHSCSWNQENISGIFRDVLQFSSVHLISSLKAYIPFISVFFCPRCSWHVNGLWGQVSDNKAFNRLFSFVGHRTMNQDMWVSSAILMNVLMANSCKDVTFMLVNKKVHCESAVFPQIYNHKESHQKVSNLFTVWLLDVHVCWRFRVLQNNYLNCILLLL